MKFPRGFCTLVRWHGAFSRGLHVSRRQNARRQIAKMKDRRRRRWGAKTWSALQFGPMCIRVSVCVHCHSATFRLFQVFALCSLCLSLLPLNSGRFPQLTLIDICRCCCCLHLPAIFHLDFISHFGWPASSSSSLSLTIEIDQCAVVFSAATQFAPVSSPSSPHTLSPPPPPPEPTI